MPLSDDVGFGLVEEMPPNILLIHSDQHRLDCLGANRAIQTPHLDQLMHDGVYYENAFSTVPICTPARASLLTGAWPTQHGCLSIPTSEAFQPLRPGLPLVTELLAEAGYDIHWIGKFHNELLAAPPGYGVRSYTNSWDYKKWRLDQGYPPIATDLFGKVDIDAPASHSSLRWQSDRVIEQLHQVAQNDQAFFVRWDPPEPHLPCCPSAEYAELYRETEIPPWPSWPDSLEHKPEQQRRQRRIWGLENWGWDQWTDVVRRYYAVITQLDAEIGRVLQTLDQIGAAENTMVIYSTDHGDFSGGHGLMDKHYAMYDDIVRVPLILRWPGSVRPGARVKGFVSNEIDIAKTLLHAAGVEAPTSFVGEDLVALANEQTKERTSIFAQYFGSEAGLFSQRMVRDHRCKFVYNPTSTDEFYDLSQDPGELRNVIDEAAYREEVTRLKQTMCDWMTSIKDPLLNPWTRSELLG